jgi:hypothetical protein
MFAAFRRVNCIFYRFRRVIKYLFIFILYIDFLFLKKRNIKEKKKFFIFTIDFKNIFDRIEL